MQTTQFSLCFCILEECHFYGDLMKNTLSAAPIAPVTDYCRTAFWTRLQNFYLASVDTTLNQ